MLTEKEQRDIILASAAMRGRGEYSEAIKLIEDNLDGFDEALIVNAHIEAIYAAQEGGMADVAETHAKLLAVIDPDIPTVKKILGTDE